LPGLIFDSDGDRLSPTHAVKKGTRYRYYVSTALITRSRSEHPKGRRIPAGDIEGLVLDRLRPGDRSRPASRGLASLVAADAFAGELTRGSIGTIRATVKTENTRSETSD
jgi:hypothetical protein